MNRGGADDDQLVPINMPVIRKYLTHWPESLSVPSWEKYK